MNYAYATDDQVKTIKRLVARVYGKAGSADFARLLSPTEAVSVIDYLEAKT